MSDKVKITYLYHSGYAVETANHFLVFDYYQPIKDKVGNISDGILTGKDLENKKNVYVFSSHNHHDHFDPIILDWVKSNDNITYIFSSDIREKVDGAKCYFVSEYEKHKIEGGTIKTFGSTDQGVSFLVKVDGLSIFHAGDLNWWHWKGENLQEQASAEVAFKGEIEKIVGESIDIAIFPVDSRLEEFYSHGAEYFAGKVKPKLLLPMHFGDDFKISKAFAEKVKGSSITTVEINHRGQEIYF